MPPFGCVTRGCVSNRLRVAREECLRIKREADATGDSTAPYYSLRMAEQHLAAVEMWLTGELRGGGGIQATTLLHEREESQKLAKLLGLEEEGLATSEQHEKFSELFFPPVDGEHLIKDMTSCTKVHEFKHLGKLYLSSIRICFCASVMGVTVKFRIPWKDCESIVLSQRISAGNSHGVRIKLKEGLTVDFDDEEVNEVVCDIFDHHNLGHLHNCATFFLGTGLFDQSPSNEVKPVNNRMSRNSLLKASFVVDDRKDVQDFMLRSMVWELERRTTIFHTDWRTPFLPHDGVCVKKWVSIEDSYNIHHLIPKTMTTAEIVSAQKPPITEVEFLGRNRKCTWNIVNEVNESDADGWQYALTFFKDPQKWYPGVFSTASVRRRRWKPEFSNLSSETKELGDERERKEAYMDVGSNGIEMTSVSDRASTIISSQKLGLISPQSNLLLCSIDLGDLPIAPLMQTLESPDWLTEGSLMYKKFASQSAKEQELGVWLENEGIAAKLKGKVRTLTQRVAIPPGPMCPETSRISMTWHLNSSPEQETVLLESVSMTLDVPYGETFNVCICDQFKRCGGTLKMTRFLALEWVQSTWMKRMIETNVREQVKKDGELFAKMVKESLAP
mmetsp:Transcript_26042/g.68408  ORF Transcript_26042/g.68408 Transcript_26042/m.68408 type:complete len:616 (-) Transcript_26042:171-2018(-)